MIDLTGNFFNHPHDFLIFLTDIVVIRYTNYDKSLMSHPILSIKDVSTPEDFAKTRSWKWENEN